MPDLHGSSGASREPLFLVLGEIAGLWLLANAGYYLILPALGFSLSYNSAPVAIACYFFICAAISISYFRRLFTAHLSGGRAIWRYLELILGSAALVWALLYLFSTLPVPAGLSLAPYTDILFSSPWYFLPKSAEVLVQQVLIAALVFELFARHPSVKKVSILYAIYFGGAHVLWFLIYPASTSFVIVTTVGATMTALAFPYLILRTRGGLVYTYTIHLVFYILLAIFLHAWPALGATI